MSLANNIFFFLLGNYGQSNRDIYIIYNHEFNNILIINLQTLNNLLASNPYQEFYENNTIILISNYEDYGREINKELKQLIIFCFKVILSELQKNERGGYDYLEKYLYNTKEEYEYYKKNEKKILEFNESFTKYYNNL